MSMFWVLAVIMTVAALLFLIPPLLRKDLILRSERKQVNVTLYKQHLAELDSDLESNTLTQEEYDKAKQELDQRLLQDISSEDEDADAKVNAHPSTLVVLAVSAFIPILAFSLYAVVGNSQLLSEQSVNQAQRSTEHPAGSTPNSATFAEMLTRLEQRLQENPNDAEGWGLLARSYGQSGAFQKAADAFDRAVQLDPDNPQTWADYADVLAVAQGRRLDGKPIELLKKALAINPQHAKSLWLMGTANFQAQDYAGALNHWEKLQALVTPNTPEADAIAKIVAQAQALAKGETPAEPNMASASESQPPANNATASAAATIKGTVTLADELASKANPEDTVFIFARAVSGPRAPLAILRKQVKDLPIRFELDDSLAMAPQFQLSKFSDVIVGARISKSGQATPAAGDLQGFSPVVKVGQTQPVALHINQEIPGASASSIEAPAKPAAPAPTPTNSATASISGVVELSDKLTQQTTPDDTVFIFARAASGPPMPLAVVRKQVKDLPFQFTLDDSKAMSPQMSLSKFSDVIVNARISKSGNAMPQSGDLQGSGVAVKVGNQDTVKVMIDQAIP